MVEPEKPFACTMPDCGMTFTNEDHLNVHTKKHDMVLQFGSEQKASVFVADQTPTPTRFIRNCEEVGLFQDLQNVNPFDEGFKRAIETKQGILSLEHGCTPSNEDLHTPQMFPLLDPGDSVFSTTNNHRNITISRSSSDETGAIKELETTRISKLTNEVTTISRIVEKHDETPKTKDTLKNSVSYTNNVIKIQSNVEIRKGMDRIEDVVVKDSVASKDGFTKDSVKISYDRLQVDAPPIMSQRSIDLVVDSFTTDCINEKAAKDSTAKDDKSVKDKSKDDKIKEDANSSNEVKNKKEEYEVILKLPDGKQIKLVNADVVKDKPKNTKDLLKKVLTEKVESQKIMNGVNIIPTITSGTLIPVSIVNSNLVNTSLVNTNLVNTNLVSTSLVNTNLVNTHLVNTNYLQKLPLKVFDKKPIRRKCTETNNCNKNIQDGKRSKEALDQSTVGTCRISHENGYRKSRQPGDSKCKQSISNDLDSRSAASRRYRARLKETMNRQTVENKQLKELNERLTAEKAALKTLIIEHMKSCHCADDLRKLQEKIYSIERKELKNNDLT